MNVKLLNVKYSPNVGDGLLVECLEDRLRNISGMQFASSVDLAGRTAYTSASSNKYREQMMLVLESAPKAIRPHLSRLGLKAKIAFGLRDHYRRGLAGADAVILGGGNLLSDQDLNFPMKITAALREAARIKARIAIYGCGVSSIWSPSGRAMICDSFAENPPVFVAVRDDESKKAWDQIFSDAAGLEAIVVNDPGIMASTVYPFDSPLAVSQRPTIALGIMSSIAIKYHGFNSPSESNLAKWYEGLTNELTKYGFNVCLFTNGSPEDRSFAKRVFENLSQHAFFERIRLASVHLPGDLCRVISMADSVVAFRMHALIAAYSFGKPFIALKWDPKVDAFLRSVELEDSVLDVNDLSPAAAFEFLDSIWSRGLDQKKREQKIAEAKQSIHGLAASLYV